MNLKHLSDSELHLQTKELARKGLRNTKSGGRFGLPAMARIS